MIQKLISSELVEKMRDTHRYLFTQGYIKALHDLSNVNDDSIQYPKFNHDAIFERIDCLPSNTTILDPRIREKFPDFNQSLDFFPVNLHFCENLFQSNQLPDAKHIPFIDYASNHHKERLQSEDQFFSNKSGVSEYPQNKPTVETKQNIFPNIQEKVIKNLEIDQIYNKDENQSKYKLTLFESDFEALYQLGKKPLVEKSDFYNPSLSVEAKQLLGHIYQNQLNRFPKIRKIKKIIHICLDLLLRQFTNSDANKNPESQENARIRFCAYYFKDFENKNFHAKKFDIFIKNRNSSLFTITNLASFFNEIRQHELLYIDLQKSLILINNSASQLMRIELRKWLRQIEKFIKEGRPELSFGVAIDDFFNPKNRYAWRNKRKLPWTEFQFFESVNMVARKLGLNLSIKFNFTLDEIKKRN